MTLDQKQIETMTVAIKTDPSGLVYPLPDEVIQNVLQDIFRKA